MNGKIKVVDTKTIEWQCSGCDHLCKLLTDRVVMPHELIRNCKYGIPHFQRC